MYTNSRNNHPEAFDLQLKKLNFTENIHHYAMLSHDSPVHNLGDEIQGFAGLQFLPFVDVFVDRDNSNMSTGNDRVTCFFNGWWGSPNASGPPPSNLNPIMLSIHVAQGMQNIWSKHIDFLKKQAPFGCRDYDTLDFFRKHGIEAYYSGCLTLLIRNPSTGKNRTENVYLVDVKTEFMKILPLEVQEKAIIVTQDMKGTNKYDSLAQFTAAYQQMEMYATAKLVVTQRIHSALLCVAIGTPVIFINSPVVPGRGGPKTRSSSHPVELMTLFHTVDLYTASMENARIWLKSFSWHNPPPNPNTSTMMRLRGQVVCLEVASLLRLTPQCIAAFY